MQRPNLCGKRVFLFLAPNIVQRKLAAEVILSKGFCRGENEFG